MFHLIKSSIGDSLYMLLSNRLIDHSIELVTDDIIVDCTRDNIVVGIDIQRFSELPNNIQIDRYPAWNDLRMDPHRPMVYHERLIDVPS